jgi:hypothetical protein
MGIKILKGDCLETLKSLDEQSINTCVTSPPYWGLRDYGTGEWVGGDPDCPHMRSATKIMLIRQLASQVTKLCTSRAIGGSGDKQYLKQQKKLP